MAVNDPKAGAVTCPVTTLAPGASTTCTARRRTRSPRPTSTPASSPTRRRPRRKNPGGATVTSNPSSHRHPGRPVLDPAADQVGRRRPTSTATARPTWATRSPGRSWSRTPARRPSPALADQRPDRRCGDLPGHDPGPGRVHHLHGDRGARDHPGRRRRRRRQQHGDRDGQGPGRRDGHVQPVVDLDTPVVQTSTPAADQVGRRDRRRTATARPIWATRSPGRSWSRTPAPPPLTTVGGHRRQGRRRDLPRRRRWLRAPRRPAPRRAHRSPRPTSTPVSSTTPPRRRPRRPAGADVTVQPVVDLDRRSPRRRRCS